MNVHLAAGTHILSCIAGDGGDGSGDSGLILDNVVFTEDVTVGCMVPAGVKSGWMLAVLGLLAGGILLVRRRA